MKPNAWALPLLVILWLFATPCGAVHAWGFDELMASLASVARVRAEFVEEKHIGLLQGPLEIHGRLEYDAPDRLARRIDGPGGREFLVEGERVTLRDGDQTRSLSVHDHPAIGALVAAIRATLAGDAAGLRQHFVTSLSGDRAAWQLELRPLDPELHRYVRRLLLTGSEHRVSRITTEEQNGDLTVTTLLRQEIR